MQARSMGAGLALAAGRPHSQILPNGLRVVRGAVRCRAFVGRRLAAMISPLIYEAVVIWTGTYLVFFLLMATMSVSNLYMVAWIISVDWGQGPLESQRESAPSKKCFSLFFYTFCGASWMFTNMVLSWLSRQKGGPFARDQRPAIR